MAYKDKYRGRPDRLKETLRDGVSKQRMNDLISAEKAQEKIKGKKLVPHPTIPRTYVYV